MTNITQDPIRALIAKHHELLDQNPDVGVGLFQQAGAGVWFVIMTSRSRHDDTRLETIANGRGETPDEACANALKDLQKRQDEACEGMGAK